MTLSSSPIFLSRGRNFTLTAPALDFYPGEIFGILGPNGAGKSTLLHILAGTLKPNSGEAMWSGTPRTQMSGRRWARRIAFIPQESSTELNITVQQFVALGRIPFRGLFRPFSNTDQTAVASAIERCGLNDLTETPFSVLSGGQRQKAKIARALAQEPRVLLLDEPTNHLDLAAIRDTASLLRNLAFGGVTLIMSLHDLDLASVITNRVAIVDRGTVSAIGSTSTVLNETSIREHWGVTTHRVEAGSGSRFLLQHDEDDAAPPAHASTLQTPESFSL